MDSISNKKFLFSIFDKDELIDQRDKIEEIKLTTMNIDFLRKIDRLGFNEYEKKEFIKEMLALSPKEREEIFENIISRQPVGTEQFSKEILNELTYKDLLLQIFDVNITEKKRTQLGKIPLTLVSEKFLNKVDALGLKGINKINFIREMIALSPKEREEIITNILDKIAKKNSQNKTNKL